MTRNYNFLNSIRPVRKPLAEAEEGILQPKQAGFFQDPNNRQALLRAGLGLVASNSRVTRDPTTAGGSIAEALTNFVDTRDALRRRDREDRLQDQKLARDEQLLDLQERNSNSRNQLLQEDILTKRGLRDSQIRGANLKNDLVEGKINALNVEAQTPKLSPVQEKLAIEAGKLDLKRLDNAQQESDSALELQSKIEVLDQALSKVNHSGLPFGLSNPSFAILPGGDTVSDRGTVRSLSENIRLDLISQTKGSISEREFATFGNATPGLNNTPAANKKIINAYKAGINRTIQRGQFQQEWLNTYANLQGSTTAWNKYINENPIIDDNLNINSGNISNWRAYLDPQVINGQQKVLNGSDITGFSDEAVESVNSEFQKINNTVNSFLR